MSVDPSAEGRALAFQQETGEAVRLEYEVLRKQIADADRTCVILMGALITATLTLASFAVAQKSAILAVLLVPLWLIGHLYLAEKRAVIVHTAHYIWTELESRHAGLDWEGWHHRQIHQHGPTAPRFYPFYLECAIASTVVALDPFLVVHVLHRWLAAEVFVSAALAVGFFAVLLYGIVRYTRFERYLAELAVTVPETSDTRGDIAARSTSPGTAE